MKDRKEKYGHLRAQLQQLTMKQGMGGKMPSKLNVSLTFQSVPSKTGVH